MPTVTIITITFNAQEFLERTILSISNQNCDDYEYILVDGGSKDDTLKIAEKYNSFFDKIISESDGGLYDAMNKGLSLATGKYVWFMNAGDEIAENVAISKLKIIAERNPDIIFGETLIIGINGEELGTRSELSPHKLPSELSWRLYTKGMLVCHQSFIVKRKIAPKYTLNNLSADIDWEINCLKVSKLNLKYEGVLSKYLEGGVSHASMFKSWKDRYLVLRAHFGFFQNLINHLKIIFRADILNILRLSKYVK